MVYFTFMSAASSQEKVPLSAMEKVAWVEFVVALTASVVVLSLVPWLGDAATSGFAIVGLCCPRLLVHPEPQEDDFGR